MWQGKGNLTRGKFGTAPPGFEGAVGSMGKKTYASAAAASLASS